MKIALTLIGPFKSPLLYYWDIISDVVEMVRLNENCHYKYFYASVIFLTLNYFTTVILLVLHMKQNFIRALFYPFYYTRNFITQIWKDGKAIWSGETLKSELDDTKIFNHYIQYLEITSESLPQLCLSCIILREYGFSSDRRSYRFWQVSSISSSLISICSLFAKVCAKKWILDKI